MDILLSTEPNSTNGFLKVSGNVGSETLSIKFSFPISLTIHWFHTLNGSFLPRHDTVTLCIGHLEDIFSLSYTDFPNVKSFPLYNIKKSHFLISPHH